MALLKVPVPEVDQVDEVALPPRVPDNVCVVPEQIVALLPAFTVAAGLIVKIITSLTAGQVPAGSSVVMVNVMVPAVMSAADGVYIGVSDEVLLKVPVPEVNQVEEVALPPRVPESVCVVPEQMVASFPALTVAEGLMVITIASFTAVMLMFTVAS